MVHVLDDAVDGICQLVLLVKLAEGAEIPAVATAGKRMLDVAGNGGVYVAARRLFIAKRRVWLIGKRIVQVLLAAPEKSAIADVLVDVFYSKKPRVFAKRNERRVQHVGAVEELLVYRHPESEGIRPRKHNLHAHRRIYVREERRPVDEIVEKRHFVNEHIAETAPVEPRKSVVHRRKRIARPDLHVRGPCKFLARQGSDGLLQHGRLSGTAQPKDNQHLAFRRPAEKLHYVRKHVTRIPSGNKVRPVAQIAARFHRNVRADRRPCANAVRTQ